MTENPPKHHTELLIQLDKALSDKTDAAIAERVVLRDAVCAYVRAEEDRRTPPLDIIQMVKGILSRAAKETPSWSDDLAEQLVKWCIEFHAASDRLVPKTSGIVS